MAIEKSLEANLSNETTVSNSLPIPLPTRLESLRTWFAAHIDLALMIALALAALPVYLQYDLWHQQIPPDTTYHIYAAQQMLDGQVIYRDVAIIKAPLADFVTVFAIAFGRFIHIADLTAVRLAFLAVALATVGITYLAGRTFFNSRAVGIIAALIMGGYDYYGLRAVTGPEPKALLILFSLTALVLIAKRHWLLAGLCASLAALSWQPAAMVMAIALAAALLEPWLRPNLLVSQRETTPISHSSRLRALLPNLARVLIGMVVPFALVLIYLAANDALIAARNATIGANVVHLANTTAAQPLPDLIAQNAYLIVFRTRRYCFSPLERWLLITGAIGIVGILLQQLALGLQQRRLPINLERTPFILYAFGFIGFSLIDFNFCPDYFPMLPTWAIAIGAVVVAVGALAGKLVSRFAPSQGRPYAAYLPLAVAGIGIVLAVGIWMLDARAYIVRGTNYDDQRNLVREVDKYLEPGDRVLTFGNAILLTETHRTNATKVIHLGSKSGLGVLTFEPGGVQGMWDALDRNPPKIITLARETFPDWTRPFYTWLEKRYRLLKADLRTEIRVFVLK